MKTKPRIYRGREIAVGYDIKRCIHAAECVRRLPAVFDPERRPWIEPDGATADELAATVEACPTGALTYERLDGGPAETAAEVNRILVTEDGPLVAIGRMRLVADDGEEELLRAAFCRCGDSAIKPFCDNSHVGCEFRDAGALGEGGLRGEDEDRGELTLRLAPDGPILVDGPLVVAGADGEERRGAKVALCRCGASRNKPFCDGSHTAAGFRSG